MSKVVTALGGTLDIARIIATTEGQVFLLATGYITSLDIPDLYKAGSVLALAVFVIAGRTIEKSANGPSGRTLVPPPSEPTPEPEEELPMAPLAKTNRRPRSLLAIAILAVALAACVPGLSDRPGYNQAVTCDAAVPLHTRLTSAVEAGKLDAHLRKVEALNARYRAACAEGKPIVGEVTALMDDISALLMEVEQ